MSENDKPVIEEIAPDFYRLEIPLPDPMLKNVNSYIIRGQGRNLIIDSGMYYDDCLQAMLAGLKELEVDLRQTDFVITHFHIDHISLAFRLVRTDSLIFINEKEAASVRTIGSGNALMEIKDFFRISGFPENDPQKIMPREIIDVYNVDVPLPFRFVDDGHVFDVGKYRLTCIKTPGHSQGHLCLYDADRKMLVAGDHLLGDITPGIQGRRDTNPLKDYMASLDKVNALDIDLVLPGHRAMFGNHRARILQLKEHHRQRAAEVISILQKDGMNAYEAAARMTWGVDCDSWDSLPLLQSFFATGEAFAHLTYLESEGRIRKEMKGEEAVFSLV